MKILMLKPNYPEKAGHSGDGSAQHEIAKGLVKKGEEVFVIRSRIYSKNPPPLEGVVLYTFNRPPLSFDPMEVEKAHLRLTTLFKWAIYFLHMLFYTNKEIKRIKPDIIHGWTAAPSGIIAAIISKIYKIPCVISLIGTAMRIGSKTPILKTAIKYSLDQADYIISDDYTEMFACCDLIKVKNRNRLHIPNGTDINKFKPKKPSQKLVKKYEGKIVLLIVAQFRRIRGQEFAVECIPRIIKEIPNIKLLLAGYGPTEVEVKQKVEELGIEDYVEFLGVVPNDHLTDLFNLATVTLFCSNITDYSSSSLFEAAACGCAVVAVKHQDVELIVKDKETGLIAEYKNHKDFSTKIIEMIGNKGLREKCKRNIRLLAEKSFSVDYAVREYQKVYNNVLKSKMLTKK